MGWRERITCDPDFRVGKPNVKGTRLSVGLVFGWLAQGWTRENGPESYPQVTRDGIFAALAFAAEKARQESYELLYSPSA